ncbi:protein kinase domain-containing protein [Sorangium sp. So ce1389]|uniref:serine/threonine-protein kinase n=1 Tax=Sorangium sp. So ce1389 TaxID=3133336 RepID=UPI003F603AF7
MSSAGDGPHEPDSLRGIPSPGEIVGGKYRVEHVIGQGGMGVVIAARHTTLKRRVALKFLLPDEHREPQDVARFLREAQAAAAITSQHVAHVIDVGTTEAGLPYFVMEFLRGINVAELIARRGPLSVDDAVGYVLEVCEAIAEAHALGIVHRDLKPSNIFLAEREGGSRQVKVIDFGISKALDAGALGTDGKLTSTSMVFGSPSYMSPEHVRSARNVDTRTDIWAIGVILYEMLTARLPFEAETVSAIFVSIVADPPTPPRSHRADIPDDLEGVILSCLEKRADRRPQTIADLARALAPFAPERARAPLDRILRSGPGVATVRAVPTTADEPVKVDGPAPEPVAWREATTRSKPSPASHPEPRAAPVHDAEEPDRPKGTTAAGGAPTLQHDRKANATPIGQRATPSPYARTDRYADEEDRASAMARTWRPSRRVHHALFGAAAVVAFAGLGLLASSRLGEREPGPKSEPLHREQQRQRVNEACKQSRTHLHSGAALGPFEAVGWEVDLWLARGGGEPDAEERPSPDGGARAPAGSHTGDAARAPAGSRTGDAPPVTSASAPPLTAAFLRDIANGGRITPALDAALSRVGDGTVAVKEGSPASSRPFSDITVTFGEGYGRAFFDVQFRPRFIAVAERLYQTADAELGALYARCAELMVPDIGVWFRGRDASGAAASLLRHMEMHAEMTHPTFAALSPLDEAGRVHSLRAMVRGTGLDDKALQALLDRLGADVLPSRTGTTVTFPAEAPLRARIVSRELSDVLASAERHAP